MIKRIVDLDFENWHEDRVASEIDDLQNSGFEVTNVVRASRMFWAFSQNVTEIYYKKVT